MLPKRRLTSPQIRLAKVKKAPKRVVQPSVNQAMGDFDDLVITPTASPISAAPMDPVSSKQSALKGHKLSDPPLRRKPAAAVAMEQASPFRHTVVHLRAYESDCHIKFHKPIRIGQNRTVEFILKNDSLSQKSVRISHANDFADISRQMSVFPSAIDIPKSEECVISVKCWMRQVGPITERFVIRWDIHSLFVTVHAVGYQDTSDNHSDAMHGSKISRKRPFSATVSRTDNHTVPPTPTVIKEHTLTEAPFASPAPSALIRGRFQLRTAKKTHPSSTDIELNKDDETGLNNNNNLRKRRRMNDEKNTKKKTLSQIVNGFGGRRLSDDSPDNKKVNRGGFAFGMRGSNESSESNLNNNRKSQSCDEDGKDSEDCKTGQSRMSIPTSVLIMQSAIRATLASKQVSQMVNNRNRAVTVIRSHRIARRMRLRWLQLRKRSMIETQIGEWMVSKIKAQNARYDFLARLEHRQEQGRYDRTMDICMDIQRYMRGKIAREVFGLSSSVGRAFDLRSDIYSQNNGERLPHSIRNKIQYIIDKFDNRIDDPRLNSVDGNLSEASVSPFASPAAHSRYARRQSSFSQREIDAALAMASNHQSNDKQVAVSVICVGSVNEACDCLISMYEESKSIEYRNILSECVIQLKLFDSVFDVISSIHRSKSHFSLLGRILELVSDLCELSPVICRSILGNAHFIDVLSERLQMHRLELDIFVLLTSLLCRSTELKNVLTLEHRRILAKQWENLRSILTTKWQTLQRITDRMKDNRNFKKQFAKQFKEESLLRQAVNDLQQLISLVKGSSGNSTLTKRSHRS